MARTKDRSGDQHPSRYWHQLKERKGQLPKPESEAIIVGGPEELAEFYEKYYEMRLGKICYKERQSA